MAATDWSASVRNCVAARPASGGFGRLLVADTLDAIARSAELRAQRIAVGGGRPFIAAEPAEGAVATSPYAVSVRSEGNVREISVRIEVSRPFLGVTMAGQVGALAQNQSLTVAAPWLDPQRSSASRAILVWSPESGAIELLGAPWSRAALLFVVPLDVLEHDPRRGGWRALNWRPADALAAPLLDLSASAGRLADLAERIGAHGARETSPALMILADAIRDLEFALGETLLGSMRIPAAARRVFSSLQDVRAIYPLGGSGLTRSVGEKELSSWPSLELMAVGGLFASAQQVLVSAAIDSAQLFADYLLGARWRTDRDYFKQARPGGLVPLAFAEGEPRQYEIVDVISGASDHPGSTTYSISPSSDSDDLLVVSFEDVGSARPMTHLVLEQHSSVMTSKTYQLPVAGSTARDWYHHLWRVELTPMPNARASLYKTVDRGPPVPVPAVLLRAKRPNSV